MFWLIASGPVIEDKLKKAVFLTWEDWRERESVAEFRVKRKDHNHKGIRFEAGLGRLSWADKLDFGSATQTKFVAILRCGSVGENWVGSRFAASMWIHTKGCDL